MVHHPIKVKGKEGITIEAQCPWDEFGGAKRVEAMTNRKYIHQFANQLDPFYSHGVAVLAMILIGYFTH
jgi:hypothetical protein